jgi:hypothetical protein
LWLMYWNHKSECVYCMICASSLMFVGCAYFLSLCS